MAAPPAKEKAAPSKKKAAAAKKAPAKKKPSKKIASKKAPAKKASAKKTASRKVPAKKTASRKTASKKTASKKASAKKTASKKAPAKKVSAKTAPINGCLCRSTDDLSPSDFHSTLLQIVQLAESPTEELEKLECITEIIINKSELDWPAFGCCLVGQLEEWGESAHAKPMSRMYLKEMMVLVKHYLKAERRNICFKGMNRSPIITRRKMLLKLKTDIHTKKAEIVQKEEEQRPLKLMFESKLKELNISEAEWRRMVEVTNQIDEIETELRNLTYQLEERKKSHAMCKAELIQSVKGDEVKQKTEKTEEKDDKEENETFRITVSASMEIENGDGKEIEENDHEDEAAMVEESTTHAVPAVYSKAPSPSPSPALTEVENEDVSDE